MIIESACASDLVRFALKADATDRKRVLDELRDRELTFPDPALRRALKLAQDKIHEQTA